MKKIIDRINKDTRIHLIPKVGLKVSGKKSLIAQETVDLFREDDKPTLREAKEKGSDYYGVKIWRPGPLEDQYPFLD